MSITNFNQELWTALILKGTNERMAYREIADTYKGNVKGKTVHFADVGDINILSYSKDTDITTQTLTDTGLDLNLDVSKYFSFKVDDIDKAQTDQDIMKIATRKGSLGLSKTVDTYISGLYTGAGHALGSDGTPIAVNSANVRAQLLKAARTLKDNGADPGTMWAVLPNWVWEDLVTADESLATDNTELMSTGFVGSRYGFKIYTSNNVHSASGKFHILMGDADSIRFGSNLENVEALRSDKTFGDIVRGLISFGAKVIKPTTLLCLTATEAAEA